MIVFVVLHYLAYEDTCECVSSIMNFVGTDDYQIIIVDNNSPDNSYCKLENEYVNNKKIKLIHNEENLGFAKGNNVGFKYAKEILKPDFIVMCNNDVCLMQDKFNDSVVDFYKLTNFDVMGPMIVNRDGCKTSNPEDGHVLSFEEIEHLITIYKKSFYRNKYYISNCFTKRIRSVPKKKDMKKVVTEVKKNVILHGSFLVFSKKYIDKFDGLDPRTYMYLEEDILYLHIMKNNMTTYYNPNIVIFHKEDSSTNNLLNTSRKKEMFISINTINSLEVYKNILKEYNN